MKVEFCSHLNEFGRLWEFLSKLLKFGNNDIVGSVPLQWTGIVATYLTMMITTTSMIKLIKMLKYPVVWVLARLVSVWISYSWASAILVALEWIVNDFWLFCFSPSQGIPSCTGSEAFPRTRMAKNILSSPLDNRINIIDNNILIIGLSSLSDQFGMFYQTANLVTWR